MATVAKAKHDPYPWAKWFSKRRVTLQRGKGKDYQCQTHGMVAQIRSAAKKHNVEVSIEVRESNITVTVVRKV